MVFKDGRRGTHGLIGRKAITNNMLGLVSLPILTFLPFFVFWSLYSIVFCTGTMLSAAYLAQLLLRPAVLRTSRVP